jgi:hypothetical protein
MKTAIDLSPAKNPARLAALIQAQDRANREQVPVSVYVAPSTTREPYMGDRSKGLNVWFVRLASEPAPMDAELFQTVAPHLPDNFAQPAVYTPERIRSAARDHAAYRWTKRYGHNHEGSPWTDEQRKIYDEEYARACAGERARR